MRPRIWAPAAEQGVELVVGTDAPRRVALTRGEGDWWTTDAQLAPGERYAFSVDGGPARPDPRSLSQPDGPDGPSEVVDLAAHTWEDADWQGSPLAGAVIYELHIGTFTPGGTLDSAIERLDHLVDLGVTLVELLPLATFSGDRGWGYDGVDLFAVHPAYGGPAALQRFVDAAHARGLGVCLDVVYNHLGPSGNYLATFGPYFTDAHQTPWGSAVNLDGPGSDQVRRFILDNVTMWFTDFHLDALRLDAVHALVDDRAVHLLEELSAETDALSAELGRPLTLIAESDRNDPATVSERGPAGTGGLGLHAQWADDVHHALHVLLTGETQGYYADFADPSAITTTLAASPFFHDGTYSTFRGRHHGRPVDPRITPGRRFVASLQTHDQVGNRATGERLSMLVSPGRAAAGAALLLLAPWTPMLFMGEEWGASTPWQYFTAHPDPELAAAVSRGRAAEFAEHGWGGAVPDPQEESTAVNSRLNWAEVEQPDHARMLRWYRDLIALRRAETDDAFGGDAPVSARRDDGLLRLRRGDLEVLVNLGESAREVPDAGTLLLGWDAEQSGTEQGTGQTVRLDADGTAVVRTR